MNSSHQPPTPTQGELSRRRFIGVLAATAAVAAVAAPAGAAPAPAPTAAPPRPKPLGSRAFGVTRSSTRPLLLGSYASAAGRAGIGFASYHPATGSISDGGTPAPVSDPSYLAIHPDRRTVYAANELARGSVTAIALSEGGNHRIIGSRPTGGAGPAHLSVHPGGRWLLSANYASGSVAVHPIESSGAPGERTELVTHVAPPPGPGQDGPHTHQIITSPDGGHVLAVDLGNDTVYTYRLDEAAGVLSQVSHAELRPGAGPRHLTFHPSGHYAYLANERDNTVVVCEYDAETGELTPGEPQSTGADAVGGNFPAQLAVTNNGAFAYLANRGHNSLTRYAVEAEGGALRLLDTVPVRGDHPRQIALNPDGDLLFAANWRSGSVAVFDVDQDSGELRSAGAPFTAPGIACVVPL